MKTTKIIIISLGLIFLTSPLLAITRYVSLSGNNTAPFTTMATAATTIQAAVNACNNGDVILVDDGTYTLTDRISITKGITVQSINGSGAVIIDGNHVTKCLEINHADALIDGFTVINGYNPSAFGGGANIISGGTILNSVFEHNQARDGGGVAIDNAGLVVNCFFRENLASDNGSNGYGGGVRLLNGGELRNCEITGNTSMRYGGGVNIWNNGTVYNCVIVGNVAPDGSGIRTRSNGIVYNSIIYYNTGSDNYTVNGTGYHYYNCCTTPAIPSGYSTNCIASLPGFVSIVPGAENYRLQTGSPCIDVGLYAGWMASTLDLDGNARVENGIVDLGPYEASIAPPDTDGDGIPDAFDDYPADPDRAFNNFYPVSGYGTLAFEDMWPGKGDYDFNDLVCDYAFKTVTNASNHVVEIVGTFIIKAFGASYQNGFGFQFPNDNVNQAHLEVTGYDIDPGGYISLNASGLENGQALPTVIVYDNTYRLMPWPGTGTGVNTEPGAPFVTPDTVSLTIAFTGGMYTLADVEIDQFNPFVIANLDRGVEIHLPDKPPTSLADLSLFGTGYDDSNPALGRYYKTVTNLPWGINIYENFAYPVEEVKIIEAYNHFIEWAESSGILFPDWYQDNPGYRNNGSIY